MKRAIQLVEDPSTLQRFREAAMQDVIERFNADKIVAEYEVIYQTVLAERNE